MKFALSNIAFKHNEKNEIYQLLKHNLFTGLEIAPSLFLNGSQNPYNESINTLLLEKQIAQTFGLTLVSIQSILFGSQETLFDNAITRNKLLDYCIKAVDFASSLNIPNIVFGAPKNRIIPKDISSNEATSIAIDFFKKLGDYAYNKNTCIAIEANAKAYGGNFIVNTYQAIDLVKAVKSEGFKLNLDTGTIILEKEKIEIMKEALPYTNHIHISEGFLAPVYGGNVENHKMQAKIIKNSNYNKYISVEMVSLYDINNKNHVEEALKFIRKYYS